MPNKPLYRFLIIAGVLLALVALAVTVFNRKWWIRRINDKWRIFSVGGPTDPEFPDALPTATLTQLSEDNSKQWTTLQLAQLYFNGAQGWEQA